jgi:hypothetical protein
MIECQQGLAFAGLRITWKRCAEIHICQINKVTGLIFSQKQYKNLRVFAFICGQIKPLGSLRLRAFALRLEKYNRCYLVSSDLYSSSSALLSPPCLSLASSTSKRSSFNFMVRR